MMVACIIEKRKVNRAKKTEQGDQMARIFAFLTVVYFGQLFENDRNQNIWDFFLRKKTKYIFILTYNGLG
jgi:hypothetical protein